MAAFGTSDKRPAVPGRTLSHLSPSRWKEISMRLGRDKQDETLDTAHWVEELKNPDSALGWSQYEGNGMETPSLFEEDEDCE